MTGRYARFARSEQEAAQLQADGWKVDLHQPMTHHHAWALLHIWYDMENEPPDSIPNPSHFHGAKP